MLAKELVTEDILPLLPTNNCGQAMSMMSIYHVSDLAVVEGQKLLGMVSEDDVTSTEPDTLISSFRLSPSYAFVKEDQHIFEVLGRLAENKISVIPVVDKEEKYLGVISQENLVKYYADTFSFKEPGTIIVLKIHKKDYSLSEVTRVIEQEGALVLASFITVLTDSAHLLLTLKINQLDINTILQALGRYEYDIHATFAEDEYVSDLKDRYDMLMTYLNV